MQARSSWPGSAVGEPDEPDEPVERRGCRAISLSSGRFSVTSPLLPLAEVAALLRGADQACGNCLGWDRATTQEGRPGAAEDARALLVGRGRGGRTCSTGGVRWAWDGDRLGAVGGGLERRPFLGVGVGRGSWSGGGRARADGRRAVEGEQHGVASGPGLVACVPSGGGQTATVVNCGWRLSSGGCEQREREWDASVLADWPSSASKQWECVQSCGRWAGAEIRDCSLAQSREGVRERRGRRAR